MNKLETIINSDLNNAYAGYGDFRQSDAISYLKDSFQDFSVSFSLFVAENYEIVDKENMRYSSIKGWGQNRYTTKELLKIYLNQ